MTETNEVGPPAEPGASRAKSGAGNGLRESPTPLSDEKQYEIVEWRQSQLPEFLNAKEAAAAWAALEKIEQRSHWWKVEILKQVNKKQWMSEFLEELREGYGIEISKQYANELRHLGNSLDEVADISATFVDEVQQLPVGTAIKVMRAEDKEIALEVAKHGTQKSVDQYLQEERMAAADPLTPIQLRLFNSWNFSEAIHGVSNYEWGFNSGHIIENLLYYYTQESDIVIDPMAGSGTTIDACERMRRQCRAFDKNPTRADIEKNDLMQGIPLPNEIAQFVFLDPPYYTAMKNKFNSYEEWEALVVKAISETKRLLVIGGFVALIMMNLTSKKYKPHLALIGECYDFLKCQDGFEFENMILAPLPFNRPGFEVERIKKNQEMLNLARLLWVFRRVA